MAAQQTDGKQTHALFSEAQQVTQKQRADPPGHRPPTGQGLLGTRTRRTQNQSPSSAAGGRGVPLIGTAEGGQEGCKGRRTGVRCRQDW